MPVQWVRCYALNHSQYLKFVWDENRDRFLLPRLLWLFLRHLLNCPAFLHWLQTIHYRNWLHWKHHPENIPYDSFPASNDYLHALNKEAPENFLLIVITACLLIHALLFERVDWPAAIQPTFHFAGAFPWYFF